MLGFISGLKNPSRRIASQARISWFEQEAVYIDIKGFPDGEAGKVAGIGTLSFTAAQLLTNLGYCPTSDRLAQLLADGRDIVEQLVQDQGGFGESKDSTILKLPRSGQSIGFTARFGRLGESMRFGFDMHGFDEQATGAGYYAPMSVLALMRYLVRLDSQDSTYTSGLGIACEVIAKFYADGELTLANRLEAGAFATGAGCHAYEL